jgi:hypothetical protein
MAEFQTVLGIILIVAAVILVAIAAYTLVVVSKSTTSSNDVNSNMTDMDRNGAIAANVITALIAVVIGVFGIIIVMPQKSGPKGTPAMQTSRSLSGTVLSPSAM